MTQTTTDSSPENNPRRFGLEDMSRLATIAIAIVAVLGALVTTIHFTIRVDITPSLVRLDDRVAVIEKQQTQIAEDVAEVKALLQRRR